jgi:ABC-2 type transport system ATP-binding protein
MSMVETTATIDQSSLIAVQGLAKRFGARTAIEKLSINLPAGQVFGLIGANGGGKTTTLRMLAGLLKPDGGGGTVLGCDVLKDSARIRERIGYMSQSFSMYPTLTVYENLRFRADIFAVAKPRLVAEQVIETFGLGEFRNVAAGKLSGGWARLLQLAVSLVHRPQLVLLDEPTAGLDAAHRHEVWRHIMNLARSGAAIVLSTHDLAEAERCAQLALLSQGGVRASGTAQQVIDQAVAIALRVSGEHVFSLAEVLARIPEVLATYPHGRSLHIVVEPAAVTSVQRVIENHACRHAQIDLSFEDAALVLSTREPRMASRVAI